VPESALAAWRIEPAASAGYGKGVSGRRGGDFHGLNATGAPGGTTHIIHEQRFGIKNQIEVDVPINYQDINHTWYGGVGDTTLGLKRVMFSRLQSTRF